MAASTAYNHDKVDDVATESDTSEATPKKVIIIDNNPLSIASYMEDHPDVNLDTREKGMTAFSKSIKRSDCTHCKKKTITKMKNVECDINEDYGLSIPVCLKCGEERS
jgi:macrodomain Ter protein organizer (MatP/YcbG family)